MGADLTPVERVGPLYVKRDDLYTWAGSAGGKARAIRKTIEDTGPIQGIVTAGPRDSSQAVVVATIAKTLNVPCQVHVPSGEVGPSIKRAQDLGAIILPENPGYHNVLVAHGRETAALLGWLWIAPGCEGNTMVFETAGQVENIPAGNRIVVPVGSGMTMSGVLAGLLTYGLTNPVLGVMCGGDPTRRLDAWAPPGWRERAKLADGGHRAASARLGGLELNAGYEAKCLPFLKADDVLWVVGGP